MLNINDKKMRIAFVGLGTALIAVSAFIRIPTPFVPLTMQLFIILLIPAIFGWRIAGAANALYIFLGLAGFPIFAGGGGIAYILKPSFGYLIGFLTAAIISGLITQQGGLKFTILGSFTGLIVLETIGAAGMWLNLLLVQGKEISFLTVVTLYAIPFLLPDVIKTVLVIIIAAPVKKALSRINH